MKEQVKSSTFMLRIVNLAWKNIWRNKLRSGVILGAITIGLFAGTFMISSMSGWILGTVISDIETQFSHIQIHDTAFRANSDIKAYFISRDVARNVSALTHNVSTLTHNAPILITYRLNLTGMLASPYQVIGVNAKGVSVDEEKQVTTVWKQIPDSLGAFLPDDSRLGIVISRKIADKLKVKLRSKVVFTFQDVHGDMRSIAFRVCGIYKTTNGMFDETNVMMRYDDLFHYTGLPPGAVHEAAILLPDLETCKTVAPQLKQMFPDMDVQDWTELNPALSMAMAYTDFMAVVMLAIFLLALSFGIINTMLMAVLERTHELAMLGAIGMSKGKIFSMIMLETVFLTLLGSIVGIILGIAVITPLLETGIDLSFFIEDQFEDFGFSSIIYPVLHIKMITEILVLVILTGIMSAIYPARKALKRTLMNIL